MITREAFRPLHITLYSRGGEGAPTDNVTDAVVIADADRVVVFDPNPLPVTDLDRFSIMDFEPNRLSDRDFDGLSVTDVDPLAT